MLRAEKCFENNQTGDSLLGNERPPFPTSPPESPKGGRFGGRGEGLVGTPTQGGARGDGGPKLLPSLALGYLLTPLQGSQDEAAASLPPNFLKNVQSPDFRFRGNDVPFGFLVQRMRSLAASSPTDLTVSPRQAASNKFLLSLHDVTAARNRLPNESHWPLRKCLGRPRFMMTFPAWDVQLKLLRVGSYAISRIEAAGVMR